MFHAQATQLQLEDTFIAAWRIYRCTIVMIYVHSGHKFNPQEKGRRAKSMLSLCGGSYVPLEFCIWVRNNNTAEKTHLRFQALRRIKALSTQKTIVIHNNSEIPVDFSWRAFPSIQEEISQKLKLQVGWWFLGLTRLMHCWGLFCCDWLIGISRARAS